MGNMVLADKGVACSASAASAAAGAAVAGLALTPSTGSGAAGGSGAEALTPRTSKTSKQYACTHCSYSADKKVSLNRHMRMHQSSPAAVMHGGTPAPANIIVAAPGVVLGASMAGAGAPHLLEETSSQVSRLLVLYTDF